MPKSYAQQQRKMKPAFFVIVGNQWARMYGDRICRNQQEAKVSSRRQNFFPAFNNGSILWGKLNLSGFAMPEGGKFRLWCWAESDMAPSISGSAINLELKEQIPSTSGYVLYVPRVLFSSLV